MQFKIFSIGQIVTWDATLLISEATTINGYKNDLDSSGPYEVTGIYDLMTSQRLTTEAEILACETQAVFLNGGDVPYSSMWLKSTN